MKTLRSLREKIEKNVKELNIMRRFAICYLLVAILSSCWLEGDIDSFIAKGLQGKETETETETVYNVTFDKNGGDTDANPNTKKVTPPAVTVDSLPASPTRAGYIFLGWNTQKDGSGLSFNVMTAVTKDMTVYAQWEYVPPNSYTVTFNKNNTDAGSTEANPLSKIVTAPATTVVTLPASPVRTGYTFSGWNTQANGLGAAFTVVTPVTSNITVYAQWLADIEMVWISPGTFTMGSPSGEIRRDNNENQNRQVTLSAFKIGKYEVTQEQWQVVMENNTNGISENPSFDSSGPASGEVQARRPVESVSWYDVLVFCNRLSIMEGLTPAYSINSSTDPYDWGTVPTSSNAIWNNAVTIVTGSTGYRLPTEAQWEYACRAGTTTAFNDGITDDWNQSDAVQKLGWYGSNSSSSGSKTHEVGKKAANNWGLYDMHGNVSEWCWDRSATYYPSSNENDPTGPTTGSNRVVRGGNWFITAQFARSASRTYESPGGRGGALGFRLVLP